MLSTFSGWEDLWSRKQKSLSSWSRTDAANEKESFHLVLHLVKPQCTLSNRRPKTNPLVISFVFYSPLYPCQVCERSGILRPLAGRVQVGDEPLLNPVCVRLGGNPCSVSGTRRPALQPTVLSKWVPCHWRPGLSADAGRPWGYVTIFIYKQVVFPPAEVLG